MTDVMDAPTLMDDPPEVPAQPVMMTATYVELGGSNLRCLCLSVSLEADVKVIEQTSMCDVQEYPGSVKYHLVLKMAQSFDPGATNDVLQAALDNYAATGASMPYKVRPYYNRPVSPSNPEYSGFVRPLPYNAFGGDAGTASEVDLDWTCTDVWTINKGTPVAATSGVAGQPGYFLPAGSARPANLAALAGLTASPATAWPAGSYVITADQLGAHYTGSAWAAGIAT